jgi:hypothetical protein
MLCRTIFSDTKREVGGIIFHVLDVKARFRNVYCNSGKRYAEFFFIRAASA